MTASFKAAGRVALPASFLRVPSLRNLTLQICIGTEVKLSHPFPQLLVIFILIVPEVWCFFNLGWPKRLHEDECFHSGDGSAFSVLSKRICNWIRPAAKGLVPISYLQNLEHVIYPTHKSNGICILGNLLIAPAWCRIWKMHWMLMQISVLIYVGFCLHSHLDGRRQSVVSIYR